MPKVDFPEWFICPLSLSFFEEPVAVMSNNGSVRYYEKKEIIKYMESDIPGKNLDPVNKLPIVNNREDQLFIQHQLFERMNEYMRAEKICSLENLKQLVVDSKPEEFDEIKRFSMEYYINTIIMWCVEKNNLAWAKKLLLEYCLDSALDEYIKKTIQLLHNIIQVGNIDFIKLLLEADNTLINKKYNYMTPLIKAIRAKQFNMVQFILEKGVELNEYEMGETALSAAIRTQQFNIAQLLCEKGAILDLKNGRGMTALNTAIDTKQFNMVQLLCEKGAALELADTFHDFTPLFWAVASKQGNIVKYLLERNVKLDFVNRNLKTVQNLAIASKDENIIILLQQYNVSFNVQNMNEAIQNSLYITVCSLLDMHWKEFAKKDQNSRSLMHDVLLKFDEQQSKNIFTILFGRGIPCVQFDQNNKTLLQKALDRNFYDLAKFISDHAQCAINYIYFNVIPERFQSLEKEVSDQHTYINQLQEKINKQNLSLNIKNQQQLILHTVVTFVSQYTMPSITILSQYTNYNDNFLLDVEDTMLTKAIKARNFYLAYQLIYNPSQLTVFDTDNVILLLAELSCNGEHPALVEPICSLITLAIGQRARFMNMRADGKTAIEIAIDNKNYKVANLLTKFVNYAIYTANEKINHLKNTIRQQKQLIEKLADTCKQNDITLSANKDNKDSSATILQLLNNDEESTSAIVVKQKTKGIKRKSSASKNAKAHKVGFEENEFDDEEKETSSFPQLSRTELTKRLAEFISSNTVIKAISTGSKISKNLEICREILQTGNTRPLDVDALKASLEEVELYYSKVDPNSKIVPERIEEMHAIIKQLWPAKELKLLLKAIKNDNFEKINQILNKQPQLCDQISSFNFTEGKNYSPTLGLTPLMCSAIWQQNGEYLLQRKADTRIATANDREYFGGCHAGLLAAAYDNVPFLKKLFNVNLALLETEATGPRVSGMTPLLMAAMCGRIETVKYLLSCNANVNAKVNQNSLEYAGANILELALTSVDVADAVKLQLANLLINTHKISKDNLQHFYLSKHALVTELKPLLAPLVDEGDEVNLVAPQLPISANDDISDAPRLQRNC